MHPTLPTARFAAGIEALCGLIARHGLARRLAGPLIVLIWGRVQGIGAQVGVLLARMQAGQLRRYPARRPPRRSPSKRRPSAPRALPCRKAWLVALIPETAGSAAQLQTLLADPEIPALLNSAPQLRRALRPLCRMLGVTLPPAAPGHQPPPPAPRTARLIHGATHPAASPTIHPACRFRADSPTSRRIPTILASPDRPPCQRQNPYRKTPSG